MTIHDARDSLIRPEPLSSGVTRRSLLKTGLGLSGLAGVMMPGTTAYAAIEAANDLIVTNYKLNLPGWRAGRRLSITVIADLHAGGPNMGLQRVRQVVDAGNALNSDLIVVVAEAGQPEAAPALADEHGVVFHERHLRADEGLAHARYVVPPVVIAEDRMDAERGAQAGKLGRPGRRRNYFGDEAARAPDRPRRIPRRRRSVAGHTHGGQIRLPLLPPFYAPSQYGARFAYGHIVERGRHMIVSGGLGCSKVPLRLGVPPEILRIELGA